MSFKSSPLFVLPLVAIVSAAHAADVGPVADVSPVFVPPAPPPVTFEPLTHFHVEGGLVRSTSVIRDKIGEGEFGEPILGEPLFDKLGDDNPILDESGFYVAAALRRLFQPNMSWQIGATGTWLRTVIVLDNDDFVGSNLAFQTVDVDLGFHPSGDLHNRIFGGLRVLHSTDSLEAGETFPVVQLWSTGSAWLFGPRVGVNSQTPLGNSAFSFVAEVSGAALFGNANVLLDVGPGEEDDSGPRTVLNLEGLAGLAWMSPSGHGTVTVGYRAQQWWGLRQATQLGGPIGIDPNELIHGLFVRAGFDF